MTRSTPSSSRSRASISSRPRDGLRDGCSRHCSVVTSVPSPSTAIEPPSSTKSRASMRSSPSRSSSRAATSTSSSNGANFSPQALKPKSTPARRPAPSSTKIGPESRIHESSIGISETVTASPHAARASLRRAGGATIVTGSKAAIALATAACVSFAASKCSPTCAGASAKPRACGRAPPTPPACARSFRAQLAGAAALLLLLHHVLDQLEDLGGPGGLDGAGLERLTPVADLALAGQLVEVRARHRQADLGVGGDVACDPRARHLDAEELDVAAPAQLELDHQPELRERGHLGLEVLDGLLDQGLGVSSAHFPLTLAAHACAIWIEERLGAHLAVDPLPEHLDRHLGARLGVLGGQGGVGDRGAERVPVAAARDTPADLAAGAHRLVAERDRARVGEHDAAQPPGGLGGAVERLAADEVVVELDREAEPALVRRVVGGDVGA